MAYLWNKSWLFYGFLFIICSTRLQNISGKYMLKYMSEFRVYYSVYINISTPLFVWVIVNFEWNFATIGCQISVNWPKLLFIPSKRSNLYEVNLTLQTL